MWYSEPTRVADSHVCFPAGGPSPRIWRAPGAMGQIDTTALPRRAPSGPACGPRICAFSPAWRIVSNRLSHSPNVVRSPASRASAVSLIAKCDRGIELRGSPAREVRCCESGQHHDYEHTPYRQRIVRHQTKEEACDSARNQKRRNYANRRSLG